jgi:hypothetical protein
MAEPLDTFDEQIRREECDPYRSVVVLVTICKNSPQFLNDISPFAIAALVENHLKEIAPKSAAKRQTRVSK